MLSVAKLDTLSRFKFSEILISSQTESGKNFIRLFFYVDSSSSVISCRDIYVHSYMYTYTPIRFPYIHVPSLTLRWRHSWKFRFLAETSFLLQRAAFAWRKSQRLREEGILLFLLAESRFAVISSLSLVGVYDTRVGREEPLLLSFWDVKREETRVWSPFR